MLRILVALIGFSLLASSFDALGAEESCPVGGITVRWALSYCMTRYETDDEAHPGVSACFLEELEQRLSGGPEEDCDKNLAYKSAICALQIERQAHDASLASCVASEDMIPSVVKDGVG